MKGEIRLKRRNKVDLAEFHYNLKSKEIMEQVDYKESAVYENIKNAVRQYFLNDHLLKRLLAETTLDPKRRLEFERVVSNYLTDERQVVPGMTQSEVVSRIWQDLCSTGPLNDVLEDNNINEIQLDGWDKPWVIHREKGKIQARDIIKFQSKEHYETILITKILNACGKSVSNKDPIVDARVGANRVSIIWEPISQQRGPSVTIRKFPPLVLTPEEFLAKGTASEDMFKLLKLAVEAGLSLAVAGATGSGKTTLFKMLASYVPKAQRTFAIEDVAEMKLHELYPYEQGYQFVSHEARVTGDTESDITINHILLAAMRQTPDRIIIGEVRREADLLSAIEFANTGHPLWFTGHGETAEAYLTRLVMMLNKASTSLTTSNAHELLSESLNLIVIQKLYRTGPCKGKRKISEIVELAGIENGRTKLKTLFQHIPETDSFVQLNPISQKTIEAFKRESIDESDYKFLLKAGAI